MTLAGMFSPGMPPVSRPSRDTPSPSWVGCCGCWPGCSLALPEKGLGLRSVFSFFLPSGSGRSLYSLPSMALVPQVKWEMPRAFSSLGFWARAMPALAQAAALLPDWNSWMARAVFGLRAAGGSSAARSPARARSMESARIIA